MDQQWVKICHLPEEDIQGIISFYSERFPLEIRARFSKWIDEQPWSQIDENNTNDRAFYACPLLKELIDMGMSNAKFEQILKDHVRVLQNKYATDPLNFVKDLKDCLDYEDRLLSQNVTSRGSTPISSVEDYKDLSLNEVIDESQRLGGFGAVIGSQLDELRKKHEEFEINKQDLHAVSVNFKKHRSELHERQLLLQICMEGQEELSDDIMKEMQNIEKSSHSLEAKQEFMKSHLVTTLKEFENLLSKLTQDFVAFLKEYKMIEERLLRCDIPDWKHKQRISCNGGPQPTSLLGIIKKRTDVLCTSLIQHYQLVMKLKEIESSLPFHNTAMTKFIESFENQLVQSKRRILESTFLVDQQPPQILRKDIKCDTSVILAAGKLIDTNNGLPKVSVYLIRECNSESAMTISKPISDGHLQNNKAIFDILQDGTLSTKLKPIIDKSFKRQRNQKVADERYYLMFECHYSDSENPLKVLSVPVMVTSNISQECECLGRIVWDHQFATKEGQIPRSVSWPQMAVLLNARFLHETDRELDENQLRYLGTKLLGECTSVDQCVTLEKFCKNKDGGFTFWDWIYNIMKLIKEHLHGLWIDRKLFGFVSKPDSARLLCGENVAVGNILARFSDSVLGGISIVQRKNGIVDHIEPMTSKDFQIRPFPLLVSDKKDWKYWYLNTPKDEALSRYYDEHQRRSDETDPMKKSYKKFIWMIKSEDCNDEDAPECSDLETGEILSELLDGADLSNFGINLSETNDMVVDYVSGEDI